MRWTGACASRHRSVLVLVALALVAFAMSTPTIPAPAAAHPDRPADGVAVLAQQPLPHCAAAAQVPFDRPSDPLPLEPDLPDLGLPGPQTAHHPSQFCCAPADARAPPSW
jgi:hypothetical protein